MFTLKVRVLLATAVLSLLLIAPVAPSAHADGCNSTTTGSCGG